MLNIGRLPLELAVPSEDSTHFPTEAEIAHARNKQVLDWARAAGLLAPARDTRPFGRLPASLVDAARRAADVTSDTELLEPALSRLPLEDDFGARLVARKGRIPSDMDLKF